MSSGLIRALPGKGNPEGNFHIAGEKPYAGLSGWLSIQTGTRMVFSVNSSTGTDMWTFPGSTIS